MARSTPIKPLPFPGESPTVALALAAARKYGLPDEEPKPARARPKRKAAAKKAKATARKARPARTARKPKARSTRAASRAATRTGAR